MYFAKQVTLAKACLLCIVFGVVYGLVCFFFFQAEDGIRDLTVTGVQTCALPITPGPRAAPSRWRRSPAPTCSCRTPARPASRPPASRPGSAPRCRPWPGPRSARERKSGVEGKSGDLGGRRIIKKKKKKSAEG